MTASLLTEYTTYHDRVLTRIVPRLETLIRDHLAGIRHVERVIARAKAPDRFVDKASRRLIGGTPKYSDPLAQIQDQIGVRIIVFYGADIEPISSRVLKYINAIEERLIIPDSESAFGYFGRHFILSLPADAVPKEIDLRSAPRFFELQVKTLFQHAWAEANHDLAYKPVEELSDDQKRRVAYTAAQAWGADRMFDELAVELA